MAEEVQAIQIPEAPQAPVEEKNQWEEQGYISELATICGYLEELPEENLYTPQIRQIIDSINNAKSVDDFKDYTDNQLYDMLNTLRREVPRIEREVLQLIGQVGRARTVAVEVDFI